MSRQFRLRICPLFVFLCQIAALPGASAHEVAKHVIDAAHKTQVLAAFDRSDYLYGNELRVAVYEGKVTLSGKVEKAVCRELATQIALGIDGIAKVDNRLVVDSGYHSSRLVSQRNYSEMAMLASSGPSIPKSRSAYGNVGLSGQQGGEKNGPQETGWLADTLVTARVKFAFFYSLALDSSVISVTTQNGVVTLAGYAAGGAERALAVEWAGNLRGVNAVNASGLDVAIQGDQEVVKHHS